MLGSLLEVGRGAYTAWRVCRASKLLDRGAITLQGVGERVQAAEVDTGACRHVAGGAPHAGQVTLVGPAGRSPSFA